MNEGKYNQQQVGRLDTADLPLQDLADRLDLGVVEPESIEWLKKRTDVIVKFEARDSGGSAAAYVLRVQKPFLPAIKTLTRVGGDARFARSAADAGVPISPALPDMRTKRLLHPISIQGENCIGVVYDFVEGEVLSNEMMLDKRFATLAGTALGKMHRYVTEATGPVYATGWRYLATEERLHLPPQSAQMDQRLMPLYERMQVTLNRVISEAGPMAFHIIPADLPENTIVDSSRACFIDGGRLIYEHLGRDVLHYWACCKPEAQQSVLGGIADGLIGAFADAGGDVTQIRQALTLEQASRVLGDWTMAVSEPPPGGYLYEIALEQAARWAEDPRELVEPDLQLFDEVVDRAPLGINRPGHVL
jgi:hypothetical protein